MVNMNSQTAFSGYFSTDCVCGAGVRYLVFEVREETGKGGYDFCWGRGKGTSEKKLSPN